jgi:hypothetical protein
VSFAATSLTRSSMRTIRRRIMIVEALSADVRCTSGGRRCTGPPHTCQPTARASSGGRSAGASRRSLRPRGAGATARNTSGARLISGQVDPSIVHRRCRATAPALDGIALCMRSASLNGFRTARGAFRSVSRAPRSSAGTARRSR